jgi:hypothetical protein
VADQADVAIPGTAIDDDYGADRSVHRICGGNVGSVRGPRWTPEIRGRGRVMERLRNRLFEGKVGCSPYLYSAIIALHRLELGIRYGGYLGGKVFQGRVEGYSLDMTLMGFDSFYLF